MVTGVVFDLCWLYLILCRQVIVIITLNMTDKEYVGLSVGGTVEPRQAVG